jgi:polysaccharide pyruvyl transferase WcaK-like protein
MKLETIKEAVNKKFNLDVAKNVRQRNFTDAKKVFSKLAYESGATFREVGEQINRGHCNILHHVNSVDTISVEYKKKHDEIIQELDLIFSKPFFNPEKEKIKKEVKKKTTNKTIKEIQEVIDILTGWDIETVEEFKQTRLHPFNALIKTRVKRKTIPEIKGATLNNKVKNPVLC